MNDSDWDERIRNVPDDLRLNASSMTKSDLQLQSIWKCAFPDGLQHHQLLQLMYLMYELDEDVCSMTFRAVAHNIGILLDVNYVYLLNDVYGASQVVPNPEILLWLRVRMQACGYYEWLKT